MSSCERGGGGRTPISECFAIDHRARPTGCRRTACKARKRQGDRMPRSSETRSPASRRVPCPAPKPALSGDDLGLQRYQHYSSAAPASLLRRAGWPWHRSTWDNRGRRLLWGGEITRHDFLFSFEVRTSLAPVAPMTARSIPPPKRGRRQRLEFRVKLDRTYRTQKSLAS